MNHSAPEEFFNKANQGHAHAQYSLGLYYLREANDCHSAALWFLKAAKQDHLLAQFKLGFYLWRVMDEGKEAEKWMINYVDLRRKVLDSLE